MLLTRRKGLDLARMRLKAIHSFASTQFNLDGELRSRVLAMSAAIQKTDLAEDGRETDPHITVKYGLHTSNAADVRRVVAGFGAVVGRFGKVSLFPAKDGKDFDVVKIDVYSNDLRRLNKTISDNLECTDTHPNYHPHVTLAYVKAGCGQKYVDGQQQGVEGTTFTATEMVFSSKGGKKTTIPLSLAFKSLDCVRKDFNEQDHPRADDGKFGSGPGGADKPAKKPAAKPKAKPATAAKKPSPSKDHKASAKKVADAAKVAAKTEKTHATHAKKHEAAKAAHDKAKATTKKHAEALKAAKAAKATTPKEKLAKVKKIASLQAKHATAKLKESTAKLGIKAKKAAADKAKKDHAKATKDHAAAMKAHAKLTATPASKPAKAKPAVKKPKTEAAKPAEAAKPEAKPAEQSSKPEGGGTMKPNTVEDTYAHLTRMSQYADGLVDIPTMYHVAKEKNPDMTPKEFHAELLRQWEEGKVELKQANEPRLMDEPDLGIKQGDANYYHVLIPGKIAKPNTVVSRRGNP